MNTNAATDKKPDGELENFSAATDETESNADLFERLRDNLARARAQIHTGRLLFLALLFVLFGGLLFALFDGWETPAGILALAAAIVSWGLKKANEHPDGDEDVGAGSVRIHRKVERAKTQIRNERFLFALSLLVLLDGYLFALFDNWGAAVSILILEVIVIVCAGRIYGIEEIKLFTDQIFDVFHNKKQDINTPEQRKKGG